MQREPITCLVVQVVQVLHHDTEQMVAENVAEEMRRLVADDRHIRDLLHQVRPHQSICEQKRYTLI